jgi:hypothetical protein
LIITKSLIWRAWQEVSAVDIYSEQRKVVSGKVVSGRVNASLLLTCESAGGRPSPTHAWLIDGVRTLQVAKQLAAHSIPNSFRSTSAHVHIDIYILSFHCIFYIEHVGIAGFPSISTTLNMQ